MLNLEQLQERIGPDKILLAQLLNQFIDITATDIDNLQIAVANKNLTAIKQITHKIRGAALSVGAQQLALLLSAMENTQDHSPAFYQASLKKIRLTFYQLKQEINSL